VLADPEMDALRGQWPWGERLPSGASLHSYSFSPFRAGNGPSCPIPDFRHPRAPVWQSRDAECPRSQVGSRIGRASREI